MHPRVKENICAYNSELKLFVEARRLLKGKILACWCSPLSCHGDVLAEIANSDDFKYLEVENNICPSVFVRNTSTQQQQQPTQRYVTQF